MQWSKHLRVKPGQAARLADRDTAWTGDFKNKDDARDALSANIARMAELQNLLYAQRKHALLIVLQGMDASGKDGTIRHVMSGLNPQSCYVRSFKEPTPEELGHDFLWRVHRVVPGRGEIDETQEINYPVVMKAIVATGFKGYVAQEFIPKRRDALASLKQGVQICDV